MVIPFHTWSILDLLPPNMALWNESTLDNTDINMSDEGENNPLTPQQQMEQQMEAMQKFMEKQMQMMQMQIQLQQQNTTNNNTNNNSANNNETATNSTNEMAVPTSPSSVVKHVKVPEGR